MPKIITVTSRDGATLYTLAHVKGGLSRELTERALRRHAATRDRITLLTEGYVDESRSVIGPFLPILLDGRIALSAATRIVRQWIDYVRQAR